jgi:threonine aldolase
MFFRMKTINKGVAIKTSSYHWVGAAEKKNCTKFMISWSTSRDDCVELITTIREYSLVVKIESRDIKVKY